MQHIGKPLQARCFAGLVAMALTFSVQAQQQDAQAPASETGTTPADKAAPLLPEKIPEDFYRAELLIIERKVAPADVNEKMGIHTINLSPEQEEKLLVINRDGEKTTTLQLVPGKDLHLSSAAERLERSGRFNVLASVGWYQAFPPDHEGETLQVALGDWLESAGHREVEGTITIDRQRYLHVDVSLNHWSQDPARISPLMGPLPAIQSSGQMQDESPEEGISPSADSTMPTGEAGTTPLQDAPLAPSADLVTWIRETRRMRSEEVHFLDSPTLGVLVYFSPIEPSEE